MPDLGPEVSDGRLTLGQAQQLREDAMWVCLCRQSCVFQLSQRYCKDPQKKVEKSRIFSLFRRGGAGGHWRLPGETKGEEVRAARKTG